VADFVKVAVRAEVPAGTAKLIETGGRKIALFNSDGTFYAIDNTCKHRGGPLAEGELDGHEVTCPWHGWSYDITTGENMDDPSIRLGCYAVRVEGDDILIEI
jgi:nitrite reductase/ring-hydroxylating ferredoxin subunit